MGGRMWVESVEGEGSAFHFTASLGVGKAAQAPQAVAAVTLAGLAVLVVDDNATNRRILEEMLSHWGMQSTLAESGAAALAWVQQSPYPFAFILTDFHMPDMDGFTLHRAAPAKLPCRRGKQNHHADLGRAARRRGALPGVGRGRLPHQTHPPVGVVGLPGTRSGYFAVRARVGGAGHPARLARGETQAPRSAGRGQCRQPEARRAPAGKARTHRDGDYQRTRSARRPGPRRLSMWS